MAAMPFLCIPLFTNVLRPGMVNPTGLIRNIPSTPMQSPLADNEDDDYIDDEPSSDNEESFPLDLTRNNNHKNKSMQIIPSISNGKRDNNKAVKFLID